MPYMLSCDSTTDLTLAQYAALDLHYVSLHFLLDGKEYPDDYGQSLPMKTFFDAMAAGATTGTSQVTTGEFELYFRQFLEQGSDILHVSLSSGLSGCYHSACAARDMLLEEFPERKIAAIDTYAASLGEGLLVIEAARMLENGAPFSLIVEQISRRRHTMCQYFTVDDLAYLERGGRVSKAAAIVGTVLKIKPLLRGDDEGKIVQCGKTRGRKQSLTALADFYEKLVADKSEEIGIAHADDAAGAQFLLDALRQRGFTGECLTVCDEPVTGSHVGPGTVALFFQGIHR